MELIPSKSSRYHNLDLYEEIAIDFKQFDEICKDATRLVKEGKIFKGKGIKPNIRVKVGGCAYKLELFAKLVSLMRHIGTNRIYVRDGMRAAFVQKNENYGLLMPYYSSFKESENEQVDGVYMNRVYSLA